MIDFGSCKSFRKWRNRKEIIMTEKCELLEKCGFFLNFKANTEVVKQGWIRNFCESQEKSERCERKKIRKQTGKPPADNMAPTGKKL
jgi:hypothetical protein